MTMHAQSTLAQLVDVLGLTEVRSLVELYLDHTAAELQRLAALPVDKQIMTVHAIKGSSSQLGAKVFAAQCRAMEMQLRDTRQALTSVELEALQQEFSTAGESFRMWLRETSPQDP